jgi:hypothetical protein
VRFVTDKKETRGENPRVSSCSQAFRLDDLRVYRQCRKDERGTNKVANKKGAGSPHKTKEGPSVCQ